MGGKYPLCVLDRKLKDTFYKSENNGHINKTEHTCCLFTAALALRSRGLVIGSKEEKEEKEREREEEEEKNLQIAIRCLWDLFD